MRRRTISVLLLLSACIAVAQESKTPAAPPTFTVIEVPDFWSLEARLKVLGASGYELVDSCSPAFADCRALSLPEGSLTLLLERRGTQAHEYRIVIEYSGTGHDWEKNIGKTAADGYRFRSGHVVHYWNSFKALASGLAAARDDQKTGIYASHRRYEGERCLLATMEKQSGPGPRYRVINTMRGSSMAKELRQVGRDWRVLWMGAYELGYAAVLESSKDGNAEHVTAAGDKASLEQQVAEATGRGFRIVLLIRTGSWSNLWIAYLEKSDARYTYEFLWKKRVADAERCRFDRLTASGYRLHSARPEGLVVLEKKEGDANAYRYEYVDATYDSSLGTEVTRAWEVGFRPLAEGGQHVEDVGHWFPGVWTSAADRREASPLLVVAETPAPAVQDQTWQLASLLSKKAVFLNVQGKPELARKMTELLRASKRFELATDREHAELVLRIDQQGKPGLKFDGWRIDAVLADRSGLALWNDRLHEWTTNAVANKLTEGLNQFADQQTMRMAHP